jgi:hypothetical protein
MIEESIMTFGYILVMTLLMQLKPVLNTGDETIE